MKKENRRITIIKKSSNSYDYGTERFRKSWIGQIYLNRVKKFPVLRKFVLLLWRYIYPAFMNVLLKIAIYFNVGWAMRWRNIVKLNDLIILKCLQKIKVSDAEKIETPTPQVFPEKESICLRSPHKEYTFPEIYVTKLENATVIGGTNLIIHENNIICHDFYNFESDYTSEEMHGRIVIDPKHKRARMLFVDKRPEYIDTAASFLDACAPNYAHWMTEVLPRIAIFCSIGTLKGVPIVVNDNLHENIMESLFLIAGQEREIICIASGRFLNVRNLYVTSAAGYVPFDWRERDKPGKSHGKFSPKALELVRKKIIEFSEAAAKREFHEKIFIHRNSGYRKVVNISEIEKELLSRGFKIIQPEKFSFLNQVRLFKNAKCIIGSSGAALGNIIFAKKHTKIIILISKNINTSYWYWQNIACACGNKISYVLGDPAGDVNYGIHSDFLVNIEQLISSIEGEV